MSILINLFPRERTLTTSLSSRLIHELGAGGLVPTLNGKGTPALIDRQQHARLPSVHLINLLPEMEA
ncbi:MAG TPA: hypothetical protein VIS99_18010 [Terrimicrobiaceae bacterium]